MECSSKERSSEQQSALMANRSTLASGPRDAAMAYDEAIVANQLPYTKLNFSDGMPIKDQLSNDDGYWM